MLNQRQLAAALGVTHRTVLNWVKAGCPTVSSGRRAVYVEADVRAWLARKGKEQPGRGRSPKTAPIEKAAAAGVGTTPDDDRDEAELGPAPTMDEERRLAVEARGRLWMSAAESARDLQRQLQSGDLEPTPSHVEAIARAAKALSEAVRGDVSLERPASLRDVLVESLTEYVTLCGRDAYADLLRDAEALFRP